MSESLTVVILTHNEELHIERCIRSLLPIASSIFIVDSFSTDRTVEIASSLGAKVASRKWRNYADQFQWGLDNCGSSTWVMRMDADEYLEPQLQRELTASLPELNNDNVVGLYIKRKVFFYGKWIRYGGFYPQVLLRIWLNGKGRIEQRWMDEHIVLPLNSKTVVLNENLVDDNLKGITFWINKHNSYASREMVDLLNNKYDLFENDNSLKSIDDPQARRKRLLKDNVYSKLPIGIRAALYFFYRYFFRLGFLDGSKGFLWHFMQGFWYRLLVDIKIMEIEKESGGDIQNMKRILRDVHGISL
jgi:glycosyltransferase involved in cell wall biosynthesis